MSRTACRALVCGTGLLLTCALLTVRPSLAGAIPGATPNPTIAALVGQVQTSTIMGYVEQLSGETPAIVGGLPYTFTTRSTRAGEPIQKATQYAYEFFQAQGLHPIYHQWRNCGLDNRNVVGELMGTSKAGEIVLLTAHIDSIAYPSGGPMPGADDNASGTAAVMAAAAILAPQRFERTIRFVLFTGEEQGLCGSERYAADAAAAQEEIVAVVNLDMVAYDAAGAPIVRLHTRPQSDGGYAADGAIADVFVAVVDDFDLGLAPHRIASGESEADTYSFWEEGYPGILVIEDYGTAVEDFNPEYHTANDRTALFNRAYFTNNVKASIGTVAVLAAPVAGTPVPPTATATLTPSPGTPAPGSTPSRLALPQIVR